MKAYLKEYYLDFVYIKNSLFARNQSLIWFSSWFDVSKKVIYYAFKYFFKKKGKAEIGL